MELIETMKVLMNKMILLLTIALLLGGAVSVPAADYRIGPEDILGIRFWQDPTLDTEVRVRQDGKITLDIIGEVDVSGMTISELQMEIVDRMSRLNRRISQVVVQVN